MLPQPTSSKIDELSQLGTEDDLKKLKNKCTDKPIIALFWASWDEGSEALKSMMEEMPKAYKNVKLTFVDCDESDLVEVLDIENVQTLVVLHPEGSGKDMEKVVGVKPEQLTQVVEQQNQVYQEWFEEEKKKAFRDIEGHIGTYPFFIFVKGSKEEPKCKFTRRLVETFRKPAYDYKTFNILADERIR